MCDCERPEVFDGSYVRARKPHTCCECSAPIAAGETYYRAKGRWSCGWETHTVCRRCEELRWWLEYQMDSCYPFGGMAEYVREELSVVLAWDRPLDVEYVAFVERVGLYARRRRKVDT